MSFFREDILHIVNNLSELNEMKEQGLPNKFSLKGQIRAVDRNETGCFTRAKKKGNQPMYCFTMFVSDMSGEMATAELKVLDKGGISFTKGISPSEFRYAEINTNTDFQRRAFGQFPPGTACTFIIKLEPSKENYPPQLVLENVSTETS